MLLSDKLMGIGDQECCGTQGRKLREGLEWEGAQVM